MKKAFCILLSATVFLLCSCARTIPHSAEAKEKLEELGYDVEVNILLKDESSGIESGQIVMLSAEKDGELCLRAYFFTNESDTELFYEAHAETIADGFSNCAKNKYSIYSGSSAAIDDFLS